MSHRSGGRPSSSCSACRSASATSRSRSATWCRRSSGSATRTPTSSSGRCACRAPSPACSSGWRSACRARSSRAWPATRWPAPTSSASPPGASAAAVFVIVVARWLVPPSCRSGRSSARCAGALAIYVLAWKRGVSPYRLVLVGIGVSAMLASVTAYLLTAGRDLRRPAGHGVADRQPERPGLGARAARSPSPCVVLVPVVLCLARPAAARCSSATTPPTGSASASSGHASPCSSSPWRWPPSPPRRPARSSSSPSCRRPIARRSDPHQPDDRAGRPRRERCSSSWPTSSPAGPSRRPSCPSAWSPASIGAPYLLCLLARANKVGRGG